MANPRVAKTTIRARKAKAEPGLTLLRCRATFRASWVCTFQCRTTHLVTPAVVARVCHVVSDDGVSKLVKGLSVHGTTNTIGLRTTVPGKQVGAGIVGERGTVIRLAVDVVETSMSVWSLVLGVVDALPICTLVDTECARVANVTVNLPIASIAFDTRWTALAVEADGCTGALIVRFALFTVRLEFNLIVSRVDAKPTPAKAHHLDKSCLVPSHSVCSLVVHALVMTWEASVLETGTAFEKATSFATRFKVSGTVLVV